MNKFTRILGSLFLVGGMASANAGTSLKQVQLHLDLIKVKKATYVDIINQNEGKLKETLMDLVRRGFAELKVVTESLGKSGVRVSVKSTEDFRYVESIERGEAVYQSIEVGNVFEAEPVVGADGYTIDVNMIFSLRSVLPGGEELRDDHGRVYIKPNFYNVQSNQSLTIWDGQEIRVFVQRDVEADSVVVGFLRARLVDPSGGH